MINWEAISVVSVDQPEIVCLKYLVQEDVIKERDVSIGMLAIC